MSRKGTLLSVLVILSILASFLAACGATPEPTKAPVATDVAAAPTDAPPTEAPKPGADKQGGTLVLGFYQEPELLNSLIRTQTVASWAGDFLESALVDAAPDGTFYAQLAKEVPTVQNGGVSEDGLTITLNLNEGYLWEDGDEFTCDDVVFTWEAIMHPESGAVSTTGWEDVESITCPDDYTVVVKFAKFYAPYLHMLTAPVLPSHLGLDPAKMQEWEFNRKPLSLGPYKLEEWVSGDHMTLVRNENFWLWETEGKPYVDTIILRWIESREVGKQLIQTGELDFVWDLIEADIPEAETWEGVVVSKPPSTGTERLLLNLVDPELDAPCADWLRENPSPHWALGDPKVREAIELGIDKNSHQRQAALRPGNDRHHRDEPGLGRAGHLRERIQPGDGQGPAGRGRLDGRGRRRHPRVPRLPLRRGGPGPEAQDPDHLGQRPARAGASR